MNKTNIEWCDMTFNPVTGCLHGCPYCYARERVKQFQGYDLEGKITIFNPYDGPAVLDNPLTVTSKYGKARRAAFPYGFDPTLHMYRLDEPAKKSSPVTIFVCSMSDLFGEWVPDEWIEKVFDSCRQAPWHRYLFLTKNPGRYLRLEADGKLPLEHNFWYGSTVTGPDKYYFFSDRHRTFLSVEPILEPFDVIDIDLDGIDLVILGAETGHRENKAIPERGWVQGIVDVCRESDVPVFMKGSIAPYWDGALVTELPWEAGGKG
jgi:protein gp37